MGLRTRLLTPLFLLGCYGAGAAPAEPPFELDSVEVSAEKRTELAFRTVQIALERNHSDRVEDADLVVCLRQTPTGSHVPVIDCATNRFWLRIRAASLANGLAGYESRGGPGGTDTMKMATGSFLQSGGMDGVGVPHGGGMIKREDERVVTLTLSEYNKLKKRFGELPEALRELR